MQSPASAARLSRLVTGEEKWLLPPVAFISRLRHPPPTERGYRIAPTAQGPLCSPLRCGLDSVTQAAAVLRRGGGGGAAASGPRKGALGLEGQKDAWSHAAVAGRPGEPCQQIIWVAPHQPNHGLTLVFGIFLQAPALAP